MLNPEKATPLPAIPCDGVVGKFKGYDRENGIATFEFQKGAHIATRVAYLWTTYVQG